MAQNLGPLDKFSGHGANPIDTKASRDFVREHDEIMQAETAQRKSYLVKASDQTPSFEFQMASHPDAKEGFTPPTSPQGYEVRNTNVPMTFNSSVENQRKKFINVNEFERTPGARQVMEGSYDYPNKLAGRKDLESAPRRELNSLADDSPFRDRAAKHTYPNSLPDEK